MRCSPMPSLLRCACLCIFIFPLEPPRGIILLKDPFFFYVVKPSDMITKDLFFSGHTTTMVLFTLMVENKWLKRVFFVCMLIVPVLILIQHVHYTIDVVLAPFFTYYAYRIAFIKKIKFESAIVC